MNEGKVRSGGKGKVGLGENNKSRKLFKEQLPVIIFIETSFLFLQGVGGDWSHRRRNKS